MQGRNRGQSLYNTLTVRDSNLTTTTEEERRQQYCDYIVRSVGSDHRDCKKKKRKQSKKTSLCHLTHPKT